MRVDWRLVAGFTAVGAYFLARFFGASLLPAVGIAVLLGSVIYGITRRRRA